MDYILIIVALYRNLGQNQNIVLKFYFDICIIGLLRSIIFKLIVHAEIGDTLLSVKY